MLDELCSCQAAKKNQIMNQFITNCGRNRPLRSQASNIISWLKKGNIPIIVQNLSNKANTEPGKILLKAICEVIQPEFNLKEEQEYNNDIVLEHDLVGLGAYYLFFENFERCEEVCTLILAKKTQEQKKEDKKKIEASVTPKTSDSAQLEKLKAKNQELTSQTKDLREKNQLLEKKIYEICQTNQSLLEDLDEAGKQLAESKVEVNEMQSEQLYNKQTIKKLNKDVREKDNLILMLENELFILKNPPELKEVIGKEETEIEETLELKTPEKKNVILVGYQPPFPTLRQYQILSVAVEVITESYIRDCLNQEVEVWVIWIELTPPEKTIFRKFRSNTGVKIITDTHEFDKLIKDEV